jgi:hypothetical protein
MADQRSLQRNAADPKQVRFAERKEKERGERYRAALKAVMATVAGRHLLAELLERSGLWRTSWDPSARIHFNEGRRNFGLELLADVQESDEEAYLLMERERRAWLRGEALEAAAVQTAAATEGEQA